MSRQARPGAERAAQNAQTLKALVKLEGNKVCADCKRNKHPRWASWNLGVFICIRCSGIHRGMGTHISRVKSVDLDAWTDEQLQSVLKWGNARANKYWEAKLAPGHVPSEAKIENFIRTKYESKRWVMDGPMPDPATLDVDGDDDVPLNIVQEKAKIERSASQRLAPTQPPPTRTRPAANVSLFDDFAPEPPARPNTADIPGSKPTKTGPPPPAPNPSRPQDSLLGLDFFGGSSSAGIGRPSSAASNPVTTTTSSHSRGDLKSSILSLYASAPKQEPAPQPHARQSSMGGPTSPPGPLPDAFGGLADAFGGLSFSSNNATKSPSAAAPSSSAPFSGLSFPNSVPAKAAPSAPQMTSPPPLSGGGFFDSVASKPPAAKPVATSPPRSNGLDFSFTQKAPIFPAAPPPKPATTSLPADLFASDDFGSFASSMPTSAPAPAPLVASKLSPPAVAANNSFNSPFNLSSLQSSAPQPAPTPSPAPALPQANAALFDPWGSANDNSPWGAPEPAPPKPAAPSVDLGRPPAHITPNDISGSWGSPITSAASKPAQPPKITADEDFGSWTSASTTQTPVAPPAKSNGGFGGAPDPFANPWG